MTKKNFTPLSIGAILLAGAAAAGIGTMIYNKPAEAPPVEQNQPASKLAAVDEGHQQSQPVGDRNIHGQIVYNAQSALPPQAMLTVQLVAAEPDGGAQKIINESSYPITGSAPADFSLPVQVDELDKSGTYALQARISVGDTLWFTSESATPVELEHPAYRIHLTMVENREKSQEVNNQITGKTWLAEDILNDGVIDNSKVTLQIKEIAEDNIPQSSHHFQVTGSGGCNSYSATVTLDEQEKTIKFEPSVPMTLMACPEAISLQEAKFVEMLSKANSYRINKNGLLHFIDNDQKDIARFAQMQDEQLQDEQ